MYLSYPFIQNRAQVLNKLKKYLSLRSEFKSADISNE